MEKKEYIRKERRKERKLVPGIFQLAAYLFPAESRHDSPSSGCVFLFMSQFRSVCFSTITQNSHMTSSSGGRGGKARTRGVGYMAG